MSVHLYLCIIGLAMGCQPNNTSQSFHSKVDSSALQYPQFDLSDDEFGSFLKKISEDTVYQFSRIKFPIVKKKLTEDGEEESTVGSYAWEHMNFDNVEGVQREISAPVELVRNVRYFDPEIALEVIYVFHKLNGKWFLVEIVDNSN